MEQFYLTNMFLEPLLMMKDRDTAQTTVSTPIVHMCLAVYLEEGKIMVEVCPRVEGESTIRPRQQKELPELDYENHSI
jgi:hypothetical protein